MRIRTIKPEFFKSDHVAELEPIERLLFIGLWCCADANGVLENRPKRIKAEVLPYDDLDASQALHRLSDLGFIELYTADGIDLIHIVGFTRHQRLSGKEASAGGRYPLPQQGLDEGKHEGSDGEAPGKRLGAQEQGTGNREQGTGNTYECARARARTEPPNPDPDPDPDPAPDLLSGDGDPPPGHGPAPPVGDPDRWRLEIAHTDWAKALRKARAKIGPRNWVAWEGLIEEYGLESVTRAAKATGAADRWPDAVEATIHKRDQAAVARSQGRRVVEL